MPFNFVCFAYFRLEVKDGTNTYQVCLIVQNLADLLVSFAISLDAPQYLFVIGLSLMLNYSAQFLVTQHFFSGGLTSHLIEPYLRTRDLKNFARLDFLDRAKL